MAIPDLYSHEQPIPLVQGIVANTVTAAGQNLYVVIPSFDPLQKWGPCPWTPHGTTFPAKGAACLVATDDQGLKWIVQWIGGWT